jgi:hypothetical protein
VSYRLPGQQRDIVAGKRIVIINDVIGAGSAVLGTLKDLYECGADPVAIGALATRGSSATVLARENGLCSKRWLHSPAKCGSRRSVRCARRVFRSSTKVIDRPP